MRLRNIIWYVVERRIVCCYTGDVWSIARRIEEIRTRKGMSRQQLAERLGTTRMRIWRLENGKTQITVEVVSRIANELGVSVTSLYRKSRAA